MPPAKKRKVAAKAVPSNADEMEGVVTTTSTNPTITKLLHQHRSNLTTLLDNVNQLSKHSGEEQSDLILTSTLALTQLKALNRQITTQVEHHASAAKDQRDKVEASSLTLENLNYQRNYLDGEICEMRQWKAEELERMACDELGIDDASNLGKSGGDGDGKDGTDGGDMDMTEDGNTATKFATMEQAVDTYLLGNTFSSHRDLTNHTSILHKLQTDLHTRSSLVEQLTKSKSQLKELQKKRDELRGFLNQIPKRLKELDRAGESLSGFFGGSGVWKSNLDDVGDEKGVEKKIQAATLLTNTPSSQRTERFEMAQSNLPSPLYTLFVQLVGYKDAWSSLDHLEEDERKATPLGGFVGASGMNVAAVPPSDMVDGGEHKLWNVELSLSTADILPAEVASLAGKSSSSRSSEGDVIKIVFSYNAEEGVVFAAAVDAKNHPLEEDWLGNLFRGDDGMADTNLPLALLNEQEEEEVDDEEDDGEDLEAKNEVNVMETINVNDGAGKPYYWCQVLSGLNVPPPKSANTATASEMTDVPFKIQVCTKAVLRQLLRRIRARRTLSALLENLNKGRNVHPLPIHPEMKGNDGTNQMAKAKLQAWTEEKDNSGLAASKKRFIATIKRKTTTLKAFVEIDMQNYPAEPPLWSLQNEDGSTGSATSLGEQSGSLSSLRNNSKSNPPLFDAALNRIECHVNEDLDQFVNQNEETTYDWILIHQLADIVSCWDEVMNAGEGNGQRKGGDDLRRLRKGKDRRLVGLGERSPFYHYRQGL